ncbi:Aldehyde/histidinol dehydrogenase [Dendryphion nanum]|uniref:Aldehyde dehydrogenase n=1 Tax=Dendryphion nanum TaxID=256645 RepID=A0A9P9DRC7_9PLEO|nr:Aldehyde/histidinol dehydrogenase [Dendryphion nanum]
MQVPSYDYQRSLQQVHQGVRTAFESGITKDKQWRRRMLQCTWWMIEDNKDAICSALHSDMHKHRFEALGTDCLTVQNSILQTLGKLDEWTKDEKPARLDPINFLGNATIRKEPLGVTMIIGAWNFPFHSLLQPMVAAIAAGCAMVLKPSDVGSESQSLLLKIVPRYLDTEAIKIVSAGSHEMECILQHRFDHIFYTGSANVGKIIHAAAAVHLTPVTLELGGQGPAIVCKSADIDLAAKRIALTKVTNAGQVCLSVNHVLVDPSVRAVLIGRMIHHFNVFLGGEHNQPDYYSRIINDKSFDRLTTMLEETSGQLNYGGKPNRATRFFPPTIVSNVKTGDALLSEEIFGPILPIVDANLDCAISFTRSTEHPLVLYAFTSDASEKSRILDETLSGGVTFNECGIHTIASDAPFGGVGHSGLGSYHGKYGILTFSHLRTCMNALPNWVDRIMDFRYPPYTDGKLGKGIHETKPPFDREGNSNKDNRDVVK